uniref:Striatin, calmodulin binding protein 3 n=1 Tax=Myripristis murdjan TaxID=586833 RepID=A0A667XZU1_9TELE
MLRRRLGFWTQTSRISFRLDPTGGGQTGFTARIAFLQGERKGQENLKNDLVRRIKMLEYALKQERAKYHKLKYGTELNQGEVKMPSFESGGGQTQDHQELLQVSFYISGASMNLVQPL